MTDSRGVAGTGSEQFAGQLREQITNDGVNGPEASATAHTPFSRTTATAKPLRHGQRLQHGPSRALR
ncbi:hypothetical protein ACFYOV_25485 [Streptomyces sp. NPDC005931]|uniref:hypothetical protein n=1 Tax=Streptomyces sp. NPDC005931 TaxID=3364737 RepID=UPI0036A767EB